jgi:hypothetical protein
MSADSTSDFHCREHHCNLLIVAARRCRHHRTDLYPQFEEECRVRESSRHATGRNPAQLRPSIPKEIWPEIIDSNGGPTRIRTWNQQIMSPNLAVDNKENQQLSVVSHK